MPTQTDTPIFWIHSHQRIDILGERLKEIGFLKTFSFDHENRFAWIVAIATGFDGRINISQQHQNGEPIFTEPICFARVAETDATDHNRWYKLAQRAAAVLGQEVFWGYQESLGRNSFRYRLLDVIQPPATSTSNNCHECGAEIAWFEEGLSCGWACQMCDWTVVTTNSGHPAFDTTRYSLSIKVDATRRKKTIAIVAALLGLELATVRTRLDAGEPIARQLSRYERDQYTTRLTARGVQVNSLPETGSNGADL